MAKFRKKGGKGTPAISTAALPDIVFMLLFFFMVTTVMREVELKVQVKVPQATELEKLERKSLVTYIYIGYPKERLKSVYGTAPRVQLADAIAKVSDIPAYIEIEREKINEAERPLMTVSLKVDEECTMGIVSETKEKLRDANALKISYAARKTDKVSQ